MTDFPLKLGSQGTLVNQLDAKLKARYSKLAFEIDGITPLKEDGYYGRGEKQSVERWQFNSHRPVTGMVTEEEFNLILGHAAAPLPVKQRVGATFYSMPGSGADWTVGPSFLVGWYAEQVHGIRHQGVQFAQGGYLGIMGGNSDLSYIASNFDMFKSLEFLLETNPDVIKALAQIEAGVPLSQITLELFFSAYSKSADGLEDALVWLFGDGARFEKLRSFVKLVLNFGNPSRAKSAKSGVPGWNPDGWGISRKIRPTWLNHVVVSITNPMDFYACVPDSDDIRPPFYGEITEASTQLPYFAHLLNIGVKVAMGYVPFLSMLLGPGLSFLPQLVGTMAGLGQAGMGLLTQFSGQTGQAQYDTDVDDKIVALLAPQGLITHLDDLVGLVAALPGLQNHGMYEAPFAELGNRSGVDIGKQHVDLYVAGKLIL